MPLKIPEMQYDKRINRIEGKKLLEFTENYLKSFNDNTVERIYNNATSARFLGRGPFEILTKRRIQFSDDEIEDPEVFYIRKYRNVISRLVGITKHPKPMSKTNDEDFPKLKNLLDFFEHQGYLTEKQIKLIKFLLRKYPITEVPSNLSGPINTILHHHIKKEFMKAKSTAELAEILTDIEKKPKQIIPKKKMFFSLSQIRNELSG